MSLGYGLGDVVAAAKLAWVLYHDCYLVARDAPDEFRQLVSELASLQSILRSLRDEINSDPAYLERAGENRKQAIERTVDGTFRTLKGLEKLVQRYHSLGMSEELNFWKRIKWAATQRDIAGFRQKIMVHATTLNLCLSSVGNSTLLRIEQRFCAALEHHAVSPLSDEASKTGQLGDALRSSSPSTFLQLPDPLGSRSKIKGEPGLSAFGATLQGFERPPGLHTPSVASEDTPSTTPASSVTPLTYPIPDTKFEDSDLLISTNLDGLRPAPQPPRKSLHVTNMMDLDMQGTSNIELLAVMSDAKDLLSTNHRNQSANPHALFPFHERHERISIPEVLAERFRATVNKRRPIRPVITAKDWLRAATWWVIKSRAILALDASNIPNASINSRLNASLTVRQAHINLLKACWIMYEMILKSDGMIASLTDENRALFWTLENAVAADFERFESSSEESALLQDFTKHDLVLWEHLQPMEERLNNPAELHEDPALDPGRWITCDPKNAGFEDERVLFRCFANSAGVGLRQLRVETESAPYLVVIWTKGGESEMKITFCNQSGSLNLTRDFKRDDVVSLTDEESRPLGPPPVDLDFPGMPVTIYFLQLGDFEEFMSIPKRFFDVVQDREPKEHEDRIYRAVVETYERRSPVSSHSVVPQELYSSCELRIFERRGEDGWDTTRRLAITSSANESNPWCVSYFLPLTHVSIRNEDDEMKCRYVTMKWSDCSHRTTNTYGTRVDHVTYRYDSARPNVCVRFSFDSSFEAHQFITVILTMTNNIDYKWPKTIPGSGSLLPKRAVYNISVKYRSLFVMNQQNGWQWAELYHVPRELDFQLSPRHRTDPYAETARENGLQLKILTAFTTNYISNHVDRVDEPSTAPYFLRCENQIGSITVDLECFLDTQELLRAVTVQWQIKAVRAHVLISLEAAKSSGLSLLSRYSYEKHEQAEISIWERSLTTSTTAESSRKVLERRVLVRWSAPSSQEKTWLTATALTPSYYGSEGQFSSIQHSREKALMNSEKALIPVKDAVRGKRIDVVDMKAVAGKVKPPTQSPKPAAGGVTTLKIRFMSARDKEDFAADAGLML